MGQSGPRLYRPAPSLTDCVAFYGYWERRSGEPHRSRALPRGAATIVIDVGGRPEVDFYAGDGRTRLDVPPSFLTGAGTVSYVTGIGAPQTVLTVHFKPAGALAFLGAGLAELENACVGLREIWGHPAAVLRERLVQAGSGGERVALVDSFLLSRRRLPDRYPSAEVMTVLQAVEAEPSVRISQLQAALGWSPRRLTARFRAEVGLAPKAYQRVRRLQGALRGLDGAPRRSADIAADLGYFDQAHFVREFRAFTGMTPGQYADRRSWLPGHVDLGQKYPSRAGIRPSG